MSRILGKHVQGAATKQHMLPVKKEGLASDNSLEY